MKKNKAIALLSIISILLAVWIVATFVSFNAGIHKYNSILGAWNYDFDVNGGVSYTLTLKDSDPESADVKDTMSAIGDRLEFMKFYSYNVCAIKEMDDDVKDYSIVVESVNDLTSVIAAVAQNGKLYVYGGTSESPTTEILTSVKVVDYAWYGGTYKSDGSVYHLTSVKFTKDAYNELSKLLSDNSSYYVKMAVGTGDDEYVLYNGSFSTSAFDNDRTVGIPSATELGAKASAMLMVKEGLTSKYSYEYTDGELGTGVISSKIGDNAMLTIFIVYLVTMVVFIIVMSFLSDGFGAIVGFSVGTFTLGLITMMVAIPGIKISLLAVLGMIFALILCIDGLALTINRIREEFANGKTVKAAFKQGMKRAFRPILNSNVVAVIISLLLLAFTSGAIQMFAITLSIGIALSFITTVLLTRLFSTILIPIVKNPEEFFNFEREKEESSNED